MADPRAFMFMESLSRLQAAGFRLQGQTTVYTRVTEVIGDGQPRTVVHLVVCLDGDDLVLGDASGAPVENVADLPSRTMSTGVVARYEDRDGGWLVRSMTPTPVAFEEC